MKVVVPINENLNEESSESQANVIRKYLEEGKSITSLESLWLCESSRLSARIHDLRHKQGINVESVTVVRKMDKKKNLKEKRFSAYYIHDAVKERYHIQDKDVKEMVKIVTTVRINNR